MPGPVPPQPDTIRCRSGMALPATVRAAGELLRQRQRAVLAAGGRIADPDQRARLGGIAGHDRARCRRRAAPRRGLALCCQSVCDLEAQPDLVIEGRRTLPPGHRQHDQPLTGDLDRPQLGRPGHTVVVLGRRPVLDARPQCVVDDPSGIGVGEPSVVSGRTARRGTCAPPEPADQPTEVGVRTGPAHLEEGEGCSCRGTSEPQRRTHPSHGGCRVAFCVGRRTVIEVAVPGEGGLPRLQPTHVVIRTRDRQVASSHDGSDEVGLRKHHEVMLGRRGAGGSIPVGDPTQAPLDRCPGSARRWETDPAVAAGEQLSGVSRQREAGPGDHRAQMAHLGDRLGLSSQLAWWICTCDSDDTAPHLGGSRTAAPKARGSRGARSLTGLNRWTLSMRRTARETTPVPPTCSDGEEGMKMRLGLFETSSQADLPRSTNSSACSASSPTTTGQRPREALLEVLPGNWAATCPGWAGPQRGQIGVRQ